MSFEHRKSYHVNTKVKNKLPLSQNIYTLEGLKLVISDTED